MSIDAKKNVLQSGKNSKALNMVYNFEIYYRVLGLY